MKKLGSSIKNFSARFKKSYQCMLDLFKFNEFESKGAGAYAFAMPPSFVSKLRLAEYDYDNEVFWLTDAKTPVAMYEIKGIATDGASPEDFRKYEQKIFELLSIFPKYSEKDSPFAVSMYAKDESSYEELYTRVESAVPENLKDTKLTQTYLKLLKQHFKEMSNSDNAFVDSNGAKFKLKTRKTRLVFYRKNHKSTPERALKELNNIRKHIETKLDTLMPLNVNYKRIDEYDYFLWMFSKFHLKINGYKTLDDYLRSHPYTHPVERPYGYNVIEQALAFPIHSSREEDYWKIGDTYHRYISCQSLTRWPNVGAVTAERKEGETIGTWLDLLPEGSEFQMTFHALSDYDVDLKMESLKKQAGKSMSADAVITTQEVEYFKDQAAKKNYLYPTQAGCFISATDLDELDSKENEIYSQLGAIRYSYLHKEYDLDRLDKFIRFLPCNYDLTFDDDYNTGKLTSVRHIARLAPIGYGAKSGSKVPMYIHFNRNGEVVFENPYVDKVNNRHKVVLGTTGAGKSVKLASQIISMMAMEKPYLVCVDAGKSFEFVIDFLEYMGLSTKKIEIKMLDGSSLPDVSLSPFLETKACIQQLLDMEKLAKNVQKTINDMVDDSIATAEEQFKKNMSKAHTYNAMQEVEKLEKELLSTENEQVGDKVVKPNEDDEVVQRDYIAEFLTSCLIIATNGKDLESAGLNDHHKRDLLNVLRTLLMEIHHSGEDRQLLISDIRDRLELISNRDINSDDRLKRNTAERCDQLLSNFENFLSSSLNQLYFNVPAKPIEDVDVTYFELGLWKDDKESNLAPRALALGNLTSQTMTKCEARQKTGRYTTYLIDEVHIALSSPLTSNYLVQCGKMSRKIGLDLLFATQNPEDFSGTALKLLQLFENFELLYFKSKKALEYVAEMLGLDEKYVEQAKSISNKGGYYSEALLISEKIQLLTRCIPIKEFLLMAMNNPNEKMARYKVAQDHNCDEVAAAFIQAQVLRNQEPSAQKVYEFLGVAA